MGPAQRDLFMVLSTTEMGIPPSMSDFMKNLTSSKLIGKFELIIKACHHVMAVRPVLCTPPRRVTPREMLMSDF